MVITEEHRAKYLSETARATCLIESVVVELVVVRCEVYVYVCVCGSESGVGH